jgi:predicted RNase H-like nuclease
MTLVLGIDAAWTATQPSGVALVASQGSTWRCVAVAPSYAAFDHLSRGTALDWADRPRGELPVAASLVAAVERLAGRPPDVIAIDMPLSRRPIVARRAADAAVSRRFGARGCSTHSPSATRPGALSDRLRADLEHQGFPLVTTGTSLPALIEVYPHVALLQLCQASMRLEYKAAKARKYWTRTTVPQRIELLLDVWRTIADALERELGRLSFALPQPADIRTLSGLKRYEDGLDALVCAYVGVLYATGRAEALGDADGVIWVPRGV